MSVYFEVIDDADRTVGAVRFTHAHDAHVLRTLLFGTPGLGRLQVAEVIERVGVERKILRLPHRLPGTRA